MSLRRLAPIRAESLPRAVVRSQRIAGARWGARACGCRLGRCATAAAWNTLRLWPPQAQAAPGSVRVRLGLPFYLIMAILTMAMLTMAILTMALLGTALTTVAYLLYPY